MSVLMQTDFPDPVAPAMRRWGILAISVTTGFPAISFPAAKESFDFAFLNSSDCRRSRSITALFSLFGTSIPTAAFPGIGASILTSAAARFSLISSASPTILLTFTPCSGCSSYRVTVGPQLTFVTVTLTPKLWSVSWSFFAVFLKWASESPCAFPSPLFKSLRGGNW